MFILTQNRKRLVNLDTIATISIGEEAGTFEICASEIGEEAPCYMLGVYHDNIQAKCILPNILRGDLIEMPECECDKCKGDEA